MAPETLAWAAIALIGCAIGIWSFVLGITPGLPPPALGLRGWKRQEALEESSGLRMADPAIRLVAGWIHHIPMARARARADRRLTLAGDYLGLDADGLFAMCLLAAAVGTVLGGVAAMSFGVPPILCPVLGLVMGFSQMSAVDDAREMRQRAINRNLPGAIDLLGLCVSAGLSLPQAMKDVCDRAINRKDPMIEELRQMLRQLELGHNRAFALETFAERVPIESVRDFVAAVVQSEAKGTPLRDVLATQAIILRARRSILAEEEAAKAGVKMTGPLAIMMMCNLLIIAGPLILRTMQSGFLSK